MVFTLSQCHPNAAKIEENHDRKNERNQTPLKCHWYNHLPLKDESGVSLYVRIIQRNRIQLLS